jgi:N,N'-diacetyllegionaminate synthase
MSTLREIKQAVELLRKQGTLKKNITVLHCNTEYPTPFCDANIKAMLDIKKFLNNIRVGYSDHTISIEASLAAVALGAAIIEKHFTLNKKFIGPDHKASLEPKEFKELVLKIRNIEKALGDGKKKISKSEKKNLKIARKSIFVLKDIKKGERYSLQNLTTKRPGTGISPMKIKYIIGKKSKKSHFKDSILKI